jgi:hypothetical protein
LAILFASLALLAPLHLTSHVPNGCTLTELGEPAHLHEAEHEHGEAADSCALCLVCQTPLLVVADLPPSAVATPPPGQATVTTVTHVASAAYVPWRGRAPPKTAS